MPNVSEGRRLDVVASMAAALRAAGVRVLDHSADPSHHRAVFTAAGEPAAVSRAILALTAAAVAAIDLRTHRGVHPRIGAVDVVPLVPLARATMQECVALARTIGAGIASTFGIPVYLYEEASARKWRTRLEDIRRGQFEGLAAKMATPGWEPDYGPAAPHPTAGATAVGARMPLVAFNVNLAADRIDLARRIARAVRFSSGGLPGVKAMGVRLEHLGVAQVSMNLTDFEQTSIRQAFDAVRTEAERLGVPVLESELVGLVPEAALTAETARHVLLQRFSADQILERRLVEAGLLG
ncbi:MAG: glutamate formimidoyltransferase [Acidobacteria bacterium]|nr:glutamate formimidoyltransferase [Acidobacteriota bacterium]